MGRALEPSAVANAPGYTPPDDEFAAEVLRGGREVEPMDYVLKGGTTSAEELAMLVVRAVNMKDVDALQALLITHKEFNELIWPEMPQSRPVTNIEADHAWGFHMRGASSGARRGVHDYESQTPLMVESIDFTIGRAPFTNFTLYRGARIHTRSKGGVPVPLDFAFTWIECNGRWKVYIYKD